MGAIALFFKGIIIVKVVPFPNSLSTSIRPFIKSIIVRVIESPSPVPPNSLLILPSTCLKASKIVSSLLAGIPIPVSLTLNIIESTSLSTLNVTEPSFVNLKALLNRFFITCANFILSVKKVD